MTPPPAVCAGGESGGDWCALDARLKSFGFEPPEWYPKSLGKSTAHELHREPGFWPPSWERQFSRQLVLNSLNQMPDRNVSLRIVVEQGILGRDETEKSAPGSQACAVELCRER